ncbi:MAG: hypothetical protein WC421_05175 [Elusimicrobiales bacterium]
MRKLFFVLAALAVARPAHAAYWAKAEGGFGADGYNYQTLAFYGAVSTAAVAGLEMNFVKNPWLSDEAYSARLPWYRVSDSGITVLRPFYYHGTSLVPTSAAGLYTQRLWNLPSSDKDIKLRWALGLGAASQTTAFNFSDGSFSRKTLPQLVYEAQFQEECFKQFFLAATASVFQYFRGIRNVSLPELAMDQNNVAFLGTLWSVTAPPLWSAGFEYTRSMPEDEQSFVKIGYHYIEYAVNTPCAHSLTGGIRAKITDNANLDVNYNWVAPNAGSGALNYYGAAFNVRF